MPEVLSERSTAQFMSDDTRTPNTAGRVVALHLKPEIPGERGLPKREIPEARLKPTGVEGDFNRYRHEEKHDDEAMAILILPEETIAQLNRDGWPVRPGDLGENVTVEGIDYDEFVPGRRFRIGDAEVVITKACDPCDILTTLPYVGKARGPAFVRTMIGRRGWYARVVREGRARPNDPISALA